MIFFSFYSAFGNYSLKNENLFLCFNLRFVFIAPYSFSCYCLIKGDYMSRKLLQGSLWKYHLGWKRSWAEKKTTDEKKPSKFYIFLIIPRELKKRHTFDHSLWPFYYIDKPSVIMFSRILVKRRLSFVIPIPNFIQVGWKTQKLHSLLSSLGYPKKRGKKSDACFKSDR